MRHSVELLWELTFRDVQIRFKQSVIGILWSILQPLALMFIFALVFGRLLNTDTGGVPYPIFVYSCLVPWMFFANGLTRGTTSIETSGGILKKVALPRVMFPLSAVLSSFVDFLAAAVVFVVMGWYYHIALTPWMLMVVPLVVLEILLIVGLSLFLSSLNAYFRDVRYGLPLVVQMLMYVSPIVYAVTLVPQRFHLLYDLNPLTGLMVGFRAVLVYGVSPDWGLLGISALVIAAVLLMGYGVFSRLEGSFADII